MLLRSRALLCSSVVLLLGCGEPVEPAVPSLAPPPSSDVSIPSASASVSEAVSAAPTPVLAPLARDERPACDVAAVTRKQADLVHGQGRSYKALRLLEAADARCPATAASSWGTKLDALSKLGRDDAAKALAKTILAAASPDPTVAAAARAVAAKTAPASSPNADAMMTAAIAAQKSGAADARLQLDRALVRTEQETAASPQVFLDTGERRALAISKDGTTAILGAGNVAVLIGTNDLHPRRFLEGASRPVSAAISGDGKLVATVHEDGETLLWDAATGKRTKRLTWAREEPKRVVFLPDGKRLMTAGESSFDATVRIWNLDTGDSADSFTVAGAGEATALAITRDGKRAAVGTQRGTLEIWTLSPKAKVATLTNKNSFTESVESVAFSPKGDKVVADFEGGDLSVWDAKLGKSLWTSQVERGFSGGGVAFSADGTRVVGGSVEGFDPALREWDAATGAALQNRSVSLVPKMFSEDAKTALGSYQEGAGVIDVVAATAKSQGTWEQRLHSMVFAPPRTLAILSDEEKLLRVITPQGVRSFPDEERYSGFDISIDGRYLARQSWRAITVLDIEKGTAVPGYPADRDRSGYVHFGPRPTEIRMLTSPGEHTSLFAASPGDTSWKTLFEIERKDLDSVVAARYGRFLVARADRKVMSIDSATGTLRTIDDDPKERVDELAISPDGQAVIVVRKQQIARFDAATGKATHPWMPLPCWSMDLSVSFDGTRVLAACSDRGRLLSFPPGQDAPAPAVLDLGRIDYRMVALAPHGDLVAAVDDHGRMRLWDAAGAVRAEISLFPGTDALLARGPTGKVLLLGKDAAKVEDRLFCRVGPIAAPFAACADAAGDEDVLQEAFAPGSP